MGKVRVSSFGDPEAEQNQKNEAKKRKEAKKSTKAPGMKGGERVVAVGPTEEELEKTEVTETNEAASAQGSSEQKKAKKEKFKKEPGASRSKRYKAVLAKVDKNKAYKLKEALALLPELHLAKFDETVELHINTHEGGISGMISLPHGTGKTIRVAIADDKVIAEIEKGKIDFDILLAEPQMMPKLAKVAKVLGPKGLMPNPKSGTVTPNPAEAAKKFAGGQMRYKTEAKAPVMHVAVGKMSFGDEKLSANITTMINAINKTKIKKVVLKSTMSPAIKVDLASL